MSNQPEALTADAFYAKVYDIIPASLSDNDLVGLAEEIFELIKTAWANGYSQGFTTMSNLPPGCSVRDIPGNRPEDLRAEALFDSIYEVLPISLSDDEQDTIAEAIFELISKAWADGYSQGRADESLYHAYKEDQL